MKEQTQQSEYERLEIIKKIFGKCYCHFECFNDGIFTYEGWMGGDRVEVQIIADRDFLKKETIKNLLESKRSKYIQVRVWQNGMLLGVDTFKNKDK